MEMTRFKRVTMKKERRVRITNLIRVTYICSYIVPAGSALIEHEKRGERYYDSMSHQEEEKTGQLFRWKQMHVSDSFLSAFWRKKSLMQKRRRRKKAILSLNLMRVQLCLQRFIFSNCKWKSLSPLIMQMDRPVPELSVYLSNDFICYTPLKIWP